MTPDERKKRFEALTRIGCIACHNQGAWSPAIIHHLTGLKYRATGKKADDSATIPLCQIHHDGHGHGISLHNGVLAWETIHGTQEKLLEQVNGLIEQMDAACIG